MRPLAAEEARDAFTRGEDIELSEEGEFPTQVGDASGNARLSIGCVHNDYGMPEQIQFWSVADNVRFGGALMAVKNRRETGSGVFVLMSEPQQQPVYKIALGIEYDGSKYYGWQRQNEVRSVQEKKLEKALSQVAAEQVQVFCAGRTDAGVHGTGRWCTLKPALSVKTPRGRWA